MSDKHTTEAHPMKAIKDGRVFFIVGIHPMKLLWDYIKEMEDGKISEIHIFKKQSSSS